MTLLDLPWRTVHQRQLDLQGHRIVAPQALQGGILPKLHASNQGTEKTKLRARTSVFWRNLSKNIEEMTKSCTICQELQPKQAREPLIQTEVPPRPWHTVGTELTYFIFIFLLTYWASLTLRTVQIQYCQPLNQSVQTQKLLNLSVQPQEQLSQSP